MARAFKQTARRKKLKKAILLYGLAPGLQILGALADKIDLSELIEKVVVFWRGIFRTMASDLFEFLEVEAPYTPPQIDILMLVIFMLPLLAWNLLRKRYEPRSMQRLLRTRASFEKLEALSLIALMNCVYLFIFFVGNYASVLLDNGSTPTGGNSVDLVDLFLDDTASMVFFVGVSFLCPLLILMQFYMNAPRSSEAVAMRVALIFSVFAFYFLCFGLRNGVAPFDYIPKDEILISDMLSDNWEAFLFMAAFPILMGVTMTGWRTLRPPLIAAAVIWSTDKLLQFLAPVVAYLLEVISRSDGQPL